MGKRHIIIMLAGVVGVFLLILLPKQTVLSPQESAVTKPEAESTVQYSLSSSILVVGETFWGRGIDYIAKSTPYGYGAPFRGITTDTHGKYQNWVGHLECPVTTTDIPYQTQVDELKFNCRPEYLVDAAKIFDIFSLGNNHIYDNRGVTGYSETKQHLEDTLIQYVGDYDVTQTKNVCEVVRIEATLTPSSEQVYMPLALCSFMLVINDQPPLEALENVRQHAAVMPVIALPQMGVEYRSTAEPEKITAYRAMIDAGADIVIGAHPHVIQNSENYNGKLIVYSGGNFLFDQQSVSRDTTLSLGVGIALQISDQQAVKAYKEIGKACADYQDTCLDKLKSSITKRPTISISYYPECFTQPNYYPEPADEQTCNIIKEQSTWDSAVLQLKPFW